MTLREQLEEDQISELRESRRKVGELLPVVVDQFGRILNGRHRREAGWKSQLVMPVKDDVDFRRKRLHFLVQRKSSQAEHAEAFTALCEALEKQGVAKEDIAEQVVKNESPFDRSYTYSLIPNRFKKTTSPRGARQESGTAGLYGDELLVARSREFAPPPPPPPRIEHCPGCGCSLMVTREKLELVEPA